jgi:hypothetical protein
MTSVGQSVIQTIEPKAIEWNLSEGQACLETRSDENVVRVVQMVALSVCVGVWVGGWVLKFNRQLELGHTERIMICLLIRQLHSR